MSERSIILHAYEVRRLLDAGEAQIWRPIRPQLPEDATEVFFWWHGQFPKEVCAEDGIWYWCPRGLIHHCKPKYGVPGERRWVKETWALDVVEMPPLDMYGNPTRRETVIYRADCDEGIYKWVSAITMPRRASRLTVEILDVEARQVQEITEEDARRAGIVDGGCLTCGNPEPCGCNDSHPDARDTFVRLWNSHNAKRDLGWGKNPLAWVMKVRRVNI